MIESAPQQMSIPNLTPQSEIIKMLPKKMNLRNEKASLENNQVVSSQNEIVKKANMLNDIISELKQKKLQLNL